MTASASRDSAVVVGSSPLTEGAREVCWEGAFEGVLEAGFFSFTSLLGSTGFGSSWAGFAGASSFLGPVAFSFFSAGFAAGADAPIFRTFAGPVEAALAVGAAEGVPEIGALGGGKLGSPLPVFFSSTILEAIYERKYQVS